ncbi:MAG: diguanylate cyclase [Ruminococcaceae bacterium]|nr:diguanylate cyclase [Oscillospiraceae bacterium]
MKEFQLLRYLSKGKFIILIVALVGAVWVYFYANSQQVYTASTVIRYANTAIDQGLTPNGSKLDVSEIYSSTVIKGAIEDMGLNCTVDEVRSKVKVTPIIPEDEQEKKETALSKGEEYSYFPTDYIITYEVGSDRSANFAGNMLDAIIKNYYSFYSEKYVDQLILPNNASNISSNDYDYIESAEIIQQSLKDVDDYLLQKKSNYPDFRASATGYSFTDLENIYSYIMDNKVPHLYASVLQNKYTKDNDLLLKKQQSKIESIEIDIKNNSEKSDKLKALIDNYSDKNISTQRTEDGERGDSSIIMDVEGYDGEIDVVTTYDDLLLEYVKINQTIENDKIDKEHAEYIKSVFVDNTSNQVLNSDVEQDIEELVELLNTEYAVVQATASELNEYLGASYLNILNSVVTAQKVNIKLYLALAVVFFLFFGCAGAVLVGRLNDFIQYILYTDKTTKLPNRQMCDVRINALSEKDLPDQFTCLIVRVDNLKQMNDTLGHSAGDTLLRDVGEILKSISRNYGFMGWNQGGGFLGLFEQCSADKADLFVDMLEKRINEYNDTQTELEAKYTVAYSNTTKDKIYDIRQLIRNTNDRIFK